MMHGQKKSNYLYGVHYYYYYYYYYYHHFYS